MGIDFTFYQYDPRVIDHIDKVNLEKIYIQNDDNETVNLLSYVCHFIMINKKYDLFPCFKMENEYYDFELGFKNKGLTNNDFQNSGEIWDSTSIRFFIDDKCICEFKHEDVPTFKKVENFIPIVSVGYSRITSQINIKRKGEIVLHTNNISDFLSEYFKDALYYDIGINDFKKDILPSIKKVDSYVYNEIKNICKNTNSDFVYISF